MRQEYPVHIDMIVAGDRHRQVDMDAARRLAESMKQIGLRQPITIRVVDNYADADGQICDGVPILVTGRHRLEAARILGWEKIDCIDADDDEVSAELWEIAENLHRVDLTKEQRDQHIRRYAELLQAKADLQSGQNVPIESRREDGRGHRPKGVASIIAEETGLSAKTVRRALNPSPEHSEPPKEVCDVHELARRRMMSAWNAATEHDRQWFRDWIDESNQ